MIFLGALIISTASFFAGLASGTMPDGGKHMAVIIAMGLFNTAGLIVLRMATGN